MRDADYYCEHCGRYYVMRRMATECRIGHVTERLSEARRCGDLEAVYELEPELERLTEQLRVLRGW